MIIVNRPKTHFGLTNVLWMYLFKAKGDLKENLYERLRDEDLVRKRHFGIPSIFEE